MSSPVAPMSGAENTAMAEEGTGDAPLADVRDKTQRPSTAFIALNEESKNQETWKDIARALDRIFFSLFLTLFVVSSIVIYSQAARLSSVDEF